MKQEKPIDQANEEIYLKALTFVSEQQETSASMIAREVKVGYFRALEIVDRMEKEGVLGPSCPPSPRKVLIYEAPEPEVCEKETVMRETYRGKAERIIEHREVEELVQLLVEIEQLQVRQTQLDFYRDAFRRNSQGKGGCKCR